MSAFGTKKRQSSAVALGFPSAYSTAYAESDTPLQFFPSSAGNLIVEPVAGGDFQAQYHEQKKRDADHMARAKVQSTRNAEKRMLVSHANYFGLPRVKLAQREFANPSFGALEIYSTRQDDASAPFKMSSSLLEGGVLRTAQGQAYGKARLMARIGQLQRIDQEKQMFAGVAPIGALTAPGVPTAMAAAPTRPMAAPTTGALADSTKIELNLLLQSVIDGLQTSYETQAFTRMTAAPPHTYKDYTRALSLIFRYVPTIDKIDELTDLYEKVSDISELINAFFDPDRLAQLGDGEADQSLLSSYLTLGELVQRTMAYIQTFIKPDNFNRNLQEKLLLSKNLVESLGFRKYLRRPDLQMLANEGSTLTRQTATDYDDISDGDGGDGRFTQPSSTREDSDYFSGRSLGAAASIRFDPDDRQRFGYNSGAYFREAEDLGDGGGEVNAEADVVNEANVGALAEADAATSSRAALAARNAASSTLRGAFDEETGGWNVETGAPRRGEPPARLQERDGDGVRVAAAPRRVFRIPAAQIEAARRMPDEVFAAPSSTTSTSGIASSLQYLAGEHNLPYDRDELRTDYRTPAALSGFATTLNSLIGNPTTKAQLQRIYPAWDGKPIRVYARADARVRNIQKNIIARLGLK